MQAIYFNPRTREGCDEKSFSIYIQSQGISIHAPVKGATATVHGPADGIGNISIHAPVKGATADRVTVYRQQAVFQSTHP